MPVISFFQCDQISYTLVPVSGRAGLISSFREHVSSAAEGEPLKHVVLVNCGATVDLVTVSNNCCDTNQDPH